MSLGDLIDPFPPTESLSGRNMLDCGDIFFLKEQYVAAKHV